MRNRRGQHRTLDVSHIADNHKYPDPGFPFGQEQFKDYIKVVDEFMNRADGILD